MPICANCYEKNDADAAFCSNCGSDISKTKVNVWRVDRIIGGLLAGVVLWIFGGFAINLLLASMPGNGVAAGDFVITMAAIVIGVVWARKQTAQSAFVVAMMVPLAGGFAVCSAIFANALR